MMPVKFNKEHIQYFFDCLNNGKAISPQAPEGWTKFDMINLAGVLYAVIISQGPVKITKENNALGLMSPDAIKKLPKEYQEANEQTLQADILGSFKWVMEQTFKVLDNNYDELFDKEHFLLVDGESEKIKPLEGFKNT